MEKVSADGVITIEENKTTAETYTEVVEGMQFDRGYVTPYMVTDTEKMETVYEDCSVLITDKKISAFQDMVPLLEQIIQSGRKLLIIAEDVEATRCPTSSSTVCAAASMSSPSRRPASATAARRC